MLLNITNKATTQKFWIIWLHGLGANAANMETLTTQLSIIPSSAIQHIFLDAPYRSVTINGGMRMRAWYDITKTQLTYCEDKHGIQESQQQILNVIDTQVSQGFSTEKLFLAGFSQGGAMALYTALHLAQPLAGVIALSAFLPLIDQCQASLPQDTRFFIGQGCFDNVVLPAWTQQSICWLTNRGYANINTHEYQMDHTVCQAELVDLSAWLQQQIT